MREYLNKTCDCCGEKFREDDDIVVCPDCGTPIHRKCWTGHCPNEHRHAEGFDWSAQSAARPAPEAAPREKKAFVCGICGNAFKEDDSIVYCSECGTPMHRECRESKGCCPNEYRHGIGYCWSDGREAEKPEQPELDPLSIEAESFEEFINEIRKRERQNGGERTCYGVKHTELLHFLGVRNFSTPRFYSMFFSMAETGRKVSLNFFAGILMPFYQLYRKMIGPSLVLSLAYIILDIPQSVIIMIRSINGENAHIPAELYNMAEMFFYIFLALRIIAVLFNDYIYMRWSVGKILALREQYRDAPEPEYMEALERAGRPRFAFVAVGAAAVSVLSYILLLVLSTSGYFA